jgi:hypothetical protein
MKIKLPTMPDPRTREGVKKIARFVVARATSYTVVKIIDQNVETDNRLQDAGVYIGAHVIGEMVADRTEELVNRKVDHYADQFAEAKEKAREAADTETVSPS